MIKRSKSNSGSKKAEKSIVEWMLLIRRKLSCGGDPILVCYRVASRRQVIQFEMFNLLKFCVQW